MTRGKSTDKFPTAGDNSWNGHLQGSTGYRRVLAALACSGVATFAQLYSVQGLLPLMSRDLGITAAQAALSVSAATVGLAIAVLPWSFVADRLGRVRTMGLAVVLATILGLLVPAAPTFEILLLLRVLEGAALGGVPALAIAYLTEEISPRHAGAAAGVYVAGTTLGGLSGRLLAGPVADIAGWRMGTLAVSLCAAAAAVGFLLLAPKPRGFVPVAASGGFGGVLRKLVPQLRNQSLLALYAQAFLLMGSFVSVYNYLGFRLEAPPYLLPASAIALLFLAYLSGTVSSRAVAGLATRLGRRTVLLAVTGRAQASSLYNLSYYAGSSVVGWSAGFLFQGFGWAAMAGALAVLAALAAAAALALLPGRQPVRRPAS